MDNLERWSMDRVSGGVLTLKLVFIDTEACDLFCQQVAATSKGTVVLTLPMRPENEN